MWDMIVVMSIWTLLDDDAIRGILLRCVVFSVS